MFDVANISNITHGSFEVEMTVTRGVQAPRTESGVLHLGMQEWHTHGGTTRPVQIDAVSVKASVDIEPDDVIAISASTGAVPEDSTWTVKDQVIAFADRHIVTWRIHEQGAAV